MNLAAHRTGALLIVLLASSALARPAVYWSSQPVEPGQAVLVMGGGWGDGPPEVEVADLPEGREGVSLGEWRSCEVLGGDDAGVRFILPADSARLSAFRVGAGDEWSDPTTLNAPEVWWLQGDRGLAASPGATIEVVGRCCGSAESTIARIEGNGRQIDLRAQPREGTALAYTLPAELPQGEYRLRLHAGSGGDLGWSEPLALRVAAPDPWPEAEFDAVGFGALPDCSGDSLPAVVAAVKAAHEAGGGVVTFPRGAFLLTGALTLPPGVTLRGAGRELTALVWPDFATPPTALISGTRRFRLQDLSLYASNHQHIVAGAVTPTEGWGDVVLERLRIRGNAYRGHLEAAQVDERFRASLLLSTGGGDTIRAGGPAVRIVDVDASGSGRSLYLTGAEGGLVEDCRLANGRWGWYCLSGSRGLIWRHNEMIGGDLMSTGGGINCLDGSRASENVLMEGSLWRSMPGWDREAMTSDAGGGAYYGPVVACEGDIVTLGPEAKAGGTPDWSGAGLYLVAGRGRGQWRRIVEVLADERVRLESPFAVSPDGSSVASLTMIQRHYLLTDNRFEDAGIAIQFYGSAIEHLCTGNVAVRSGGFHTIALDYYGKQPSLGVQFLGCRIEEGLSYRYGHDNIAFAGPSHFGVEAMGKARVMGAVFRGCEVESNGLFDIATRDAEPPGIENCLIEGCLVRQSDLGIRVSENALGVTLRDNRFEEVARETLHLAELRAEWASRRLAMAGAQAPIAEWRFDEHAGVTTPDASGNGLEARASGTVGWAPGISGDALALGGEGFLQVGSEWSWEAEAFNHDALTVSCWIRPETLTGRFGVISKRSGNSASPFILGTTGDGVSVEATCADGPWRYNAISPSALAVGRWSHLVATWESGKGVRAWVDGKLLVDTAVAEAIVATTEPLRIGWEAWGGEASDSKTAAFYRGLIDEVRIWARALSEDEVRAEYERLAAKAGE